MEVKSTCLIHVLVLGKDQGGSLVRIAKVADDIRVTSSIEKQAQLILSWKPHDPDRIRCRNSSIQCGFRGLGVSDEACGFLSRLLPGFWRRLPPIPESGIRGIVFTSFSRCCTSQPWPFRGPRSFRGKCGTHNTQRTETYQRKLR